MDDCRPRTNEMQKTLVEPLQAIFSCNLSIMNQQMFVGGLMTDSWTKNMSFSMESFRDCKRHDNVARCVQPLIEKCRQSGIVAVKVIRLHMSYVGQLLSSDPDLRLIHVVRDPRGTVESWRKVADKGSTSMTNMRLYAKLICQRMLTDCQIRRQLELKYTRRILLLRYEDLVTATDTVLNDVYSGLLQLALPSNVVDVIKKRLHATADNGAWGTLRTNGTATATNWRRTINSELLNYTTDTCRQLLAELRYN